MEAHVNDSTGRTWTLPEVASLATAQSALDQAAAAAAAAGLAAGGRAHPCLTQALRPAA